MGNHFTSLFAHADRPCRVFLLALVALAIASPTSLALPTATCNATAVECMRSITAQHSPFTNTAAPTWLPSVRGAGNQFIYIDAGRQFNTLLAIKSSVAMSKVCAGQVCRDKWTLTTYRSIGKLQYEVSASRKTGVTERQLLKVARNLSPVSAY